MIDRLLRDNLLEPQTFDSWAEVSGFIRTHVCGSCQGFLFAKFAPNRKYIAQCPEHGAVTGLGATRKHQAEQADQSVRAGLRELRSQGKARSEKTILEELGFKTEEPK